LICRIADIGVDVPSIGDLPRRCTPYLSSDIDVSIHIETSDMRPDVWPSVSPDENYYVQSGRQFAHKILRYSGFMMHSSAVMVNGYTYLFSGPPGIGKSTHSEKYRCSFPNSVVINDDKPIIRNIGGNWIAYGTPWCGKDGINSNLSAPVGGMCFLHRGDRRIEKVSTLNAFSQIIYQTIGREDQEEAGLLFELLNSFIQEVPIFDFYNHAEPGDEFITYQAMRDTYREMNNEKE